MKVSDKYFDTLFDFEGLWGMPSRCGLKRIAKLDKTIILVTELYQDNPGSTITQSVISLANQIKDKFDLDPHKIIYIECSPNTNSKLSFYDEEMYLVNFDIVNGSFIDPKWLILTDEQKVDFFGGDIV